MIKMFTDINIVMGYIWGFSCAVYSILLVYSVYEKRTPSVATLGHIVALFVSVLSAIMTDNSYEMGIAAAIYIFSAASKVETRLMPLIMMVSRNFSWSTILSLSVDGVFILTRFGYEKFWQ
jgi:hypothetical protein